MTELVFAELTRPQRYKLLTGLITPRPIAFITSVSDEGVVNAAPYSFFNVIGDEPPLIMVSIDRRHDGDDKDTGRNIIARGEFVVHLVDEAIAPAMHACAMEAPPNVSEPEVVALDLAPSLLIKTPRLAQAPVAFECRLWNVMDVPGRRLVLGEVVALHARDGLIDTTTLRVDMAAHQPIGRIAGQYYVRTGDQFSLGSNDYFDTLARLGRDGVEAMQ
jgi:flavin reductase (DIM6/NTAB) family NADH-FMN oxidoreductase RutF